MVEDQHLKDFEKFAEKGYWSVRGWLCSRVFTHPVPLELLPRPHARQHQDLGGVECPGGEYHLLAAERALCLLRGDKSIRE